MKTGDREFVLVWIAAAIGAALGDWLSYWIGTKFKNSVARTWPFSHHPHLLLRGEAFIKNWGGLAIFMGRFSGPLRASVPVAAGILGMPYWRFQLANFSSALCGQRSFWRSAISAPRFPPGYGTMYLESSERDESAAKHDLSRRP